MSGVIAHKLVRRAFEVGQEHYANADNAEELKRVAFGGIVLLWVTALLYVLVMAAISYTYGNLVATLAMVETPTASITLTADYPSDLSEKESLLPPKEPEVLLTPQRPITAKLRTAIRHLRSTSGRSARFRGLGVFLLYQFLTGTFVHLCTSPNAPQLRPFVAILASLAFCRVQVVWTQKVISRPRTDNHAWFKRYPSNKQTRNIMLPTAVWSLAHQAALYVPGHLFWMVLESFHHPELSGDNHDLNRKIALVQLFCVGLIWIGSIVLVVIPAEVTLKRVQASMLSEEDECIVPFDRTFGGKISAETVAAGGAVSMLDAWKTFGKEARMRLIKLYVKVFAIQVATTLLFFGVVVVELAVMLGMAESTKLGNVAWVGMKEGL